ncbi:MAG: rhodanese-like domain-containing protein [Synergistales bacterium]|jgi:Synergist-CTERM protein sorting domain-containing protein|nr:rhodanese-like domain-containing protein [Synergistales bacterium]
MKRSVAGEGLRLSLFLVLSVFFAVPLWSGGPGAPSCASAAIETVDRAYVKANKDKSGFVLVDVRSAEQYDGKRFFASGVTGGHVAGAVNVPSAVLESSSVADLTVLGLGVEKTILLYCNTGATSLAAARSLEAKGYTKLKNYAGSMGDWGADPAETVVIAGLELDPGGTGTVAVDIPEGLSVTWSVTQGKAVVDLSGTTGASVQVRALQAGEATLKAVLPDQASVESVVTVSGGASGGGGCEMGFLPAVALLFVPLLFLRK